MSERTIPYEPALDGVRAVAVAMVLAFHLELPGADGGYLGVSIFFTLSGYLITRLLVEEQVRTGRIDWSRFITRRARRLLPASMLAIGLVVALSLAGVFEPPGDLRREIWASIAQIFNWYELGSGDSYAELFSAPSPMAHFWSLAIEEQFYWIWPFAMIGIGALSKGSPRSMVKWIVGAFVVTAVTAPVTASAWSPDAAYLATWARAPEILAGAVVAAVVTSGVSLRRLTPVVGPLAVSLVIVVAVTPAGRSWPYQGGLPVFGVLTAVVLAGLQGPSLLRRFLSVAPLVQIGKVSYGLYVFHWPLLLWLSPERLGWSFWPTTALRLVVTAVVSTLSYVAIEQPIRQGRFLTRRRDVAAGAISGSVALAITAAIAVSVPIAPLRPAPSVIRAAVPATTVPTVSSVNPSEVVTDAATPATSAEPVLTIDREIVPATIAPPVGPLSVAIVGDSVPAWLLRDAAPTYDRTDVVIVNGSDEACDGMIDLPVGRDRHGVDLIPPDNCRPWLESYQAALDSVAEPPNVALLVLGQAPVVDRRVDGVWRSPCDGIDWYTRDVSDRIDWFRDQDIDVLFALPARPGNGATFVVPDDVDLRADCVRAELIGFLGEQNVPIIDLDDILCPEGACDDVRIDGIHVRQELAAGVLDWILDQVIELSAT